MIVPKEVLKIWKKQVSHGLYSEIAKNTGINVRTVHRAIKDGRCRPENYEKINNYFEVKENRKRVLVDSFKHDNDGN